MVEILRRGIDNTIEDKIVTAMVVSKQFIQAVYPVFSPDYIKNSFAERICKWAIDYYEYTEEAPKSRILDVFDLEKGKLQSAEVEIIDKFLARLFQQYSDEQELNSEYFIEQAFLYFRKRELEITSRNTQKLLELGKLEEAEAEHNKYRRVQRLTSGWTNPYADESIKEVFEENKEGILRLPGALGEMIGDIERGWFIGIFGAYKRGKTNWLKEFNVNALTSRLKVAEISLEMQKKALNTRFYKRIIAAGDGDTTFLYPAFDCALNQSDECHSPNRKGHGRLLNEEGERPEYRTDLPYTPCDWCRKHDPDTYEFATWFTSIERPPYLYRTVSKGVKAFQRMFGSDNYRLKIYPRFSATISDINRDLDILEETEGFVPDLISIDMADNIKPENGQGKGYEFIDEIWKELAGMAGKRHCIVASPSQVVTAALYKKRLTQEDSGLWRGKFGHIDLGIGLNQTPEEKKQRIMRVNMLAHRHIDFNEDEVCLILQQIATGQVNLDSHKIWERG